MLSAGGLRVGRDFYLAFSPERVDPGNARFKTKNIPKVIGGVTPACTEHAMALYGNAMDRLVPVSSTKVAEMVKLLENTFRSVNIGLVNEIALMSHTLGINVWEVIDAAATKPFGFMPFYPGPGLGGHCIPIDPFYLSWKARQYGFEARFIELAGQINGFMPHFVVSRVADVLNEREKSLRGSRVLVLGLTYKADTDDLRESPALDVIGLLLRKGAIVEACDPHLPEREHASVGCPVRPFSIDLLRAADLVVVVTNHSDFDYGAVLKESREIVDTRNALKGFTSKKLHLL
jgi:UDP-N-acetyl-D-glucosamine dehydrogenase